MWHIKTLGYYLNENTKVKKKNPDFADLNNMSTVGGRGALRCHFENLSHNIFNHIVFCLVPYRPVTVNIATV